MNTLEYMDYDECIVKAHHLKPQPSQTKPHFPSFLSLSCFPTSNPVSQISLLSQTKSDFPWSKYNTPCERKQCSTQKIEFLSYVCQNTSLQIQGILCKHQVVYNFHH